MKYVYILKSLNFPEQKYIGITSDLRRRLGEHNRGKCTHTNKYKSWRIKTYIAFSDEFLAEEFEKYLKSGSGREFAKRHFRSRQVRLRFFIPSLMLRHKKGYGGSPAFLLRLASRSLFKIMP